MWDQVYCPMPGSWGLVKVNLYCCLKEMPWTSVRQTFDVSVKVIPKSISVDGTTPRVSTLDKEEKQVRCVPALLSFSELQWYEQATVLSTTPLLPPCLATLDYTFKLCVWIISFFLITAWKTVLHINENSTCTGVFTQTWIVSLQPSCISFSSVLSWAASAAWQMILRTCQAWLKPKK